MGVSRSLLETSSKADRITTRVDQGSMGDQGDTDQEGIDRNHREDSAMTVTSKIIARIVTSKIVARIAVSKIAVGERARLAIFVEEATGVHLLPESRTTKMQNRENSLKIGLPHKHASSLNLEKSRKTRS